MSIYKRASGRWAVLVDQDSSATSPRKRRSLGTFRTRKEAEIAEREALGAKDRGIDLTPSNVTVQMLLERYINTRAGLGRGIRTIEEYQRILKLYIELQLGSRPLSKLKPAHVSEWIADLQLHGGRSGSAISAKTAAHAFALLTAALRWGVRQELVGRNVCESADRPKIIRPRAEAHTGDELNRLAKATFGTRWDHFIELALNTGARRGELCALSWPDVDLEHGTIRIAASMSQSASGVIRKSTKTGRTRSIPLNNEARGALRAQRALAASDRLRIGSSYVVDDSRPIFTDEIGERVTPKSATNAFARIAKTAKLSSTALHRLRHTAASMLIPASDVVTAAAILGHSSPSTTANIYAHVIEGQERTAVDGLSRGIAKLRVAAEHR